MTSSVSGLAINDMKDYLLTYEKDSHKQCQQNHE